ncbi:MAG: HNH endonuclease [bacterium]
MARIGRNLRNRVAERSRYRCDYCHSREDLMGDRLQIDHIIPKAEGGEDSEENLCLACSSCNRFKSAKTHARDPKSKTLVRLFNPNLQEWAEHFIWDDRGVKIVGLTPCGRATVLALQMNNPWILRVRAFWVRAGEHPRVE